MDLLNNSEKPENIKAEFKVWLTKYYELLSNRNKLLKSQLQEKQYTNNDVKVKINELVYNKNVDNSTLGTDGVLNKSFFEFEGGVNRLSTNMEQLQICTRTIDTKFEEEAKKFRNRNYEILTKDELALKPYHEVEEALNSLTQKTHCSIKKQEEGREIYIKTLEDRAQEFIQKKKDITMLEPIEQELKYQIKNLNSDVEGKLKLLKLNCVEEASDKSPESKELLNDINNLQSQLNRQ